MCTHTCKGLDTHMVDVIWWSLLQTRQCCVVLTNSPVSLVCVWFKLSPLSPRLEASLSLLIQGKKSHRHLHILSAEGEKQNIVDIFDASVSSKCQVRLEPNLHCFHIYAVLFITLVRKNLLLLTNNKEIYAM